jgi:acyl carrier protein
MKINEIKKVMSKVFELELSVISDDASVENVDNWNSMTHMKLIIALEKKFGVTFNEEQIAKSLSLEDFKKILS